MDEGQEEQSRGVSTVPPSKPVFERRGVESGRAPRPEPESRDLRPRRDLLAFVNALYSASIGLGLARFIQRYEEAAKQAASDGVWSDAGNVVVASIGLAAALGFVLEDWKRARWVTEDYGYRLDLEAAAPRYWCDCAIGVSSFFLVSSSLVSPIPYLFWMGSMLILRFIWSLLALAEIDAFIRDEGRFPGNSFGITLSDARQLVSSGVKPSRADYRLAFGRVTHFTFGLLFFVGATLIYAVRATLKLLQDVKATSEHAGEMLGGLRGFCAWVASHSPYLSPIAAATVLVGLKITYHVSRRRWLTQLDVVRGAAP